MNFWISLTERGLPVFEGIWKKYIYCMCMELSCTCSDSIYTTNPMPPLLHIWVWVTFSFKGFVMWTKPLTFFLPLPAVLLNTSWDNAMLVVVAPPGVTPCLFGFLPVQFVFTCLPASVCLPSFILSLSPVTVFALDKTISFVAWSYIVIYLEARMHWKSTFAHTPLCCFRNRSRVFGQEKLFCFMLVFIFFGYCVLILTE